MPNNETTTKFKVDISELTKGMQSARRQIALANAEFKSATAGMDDWSKSSDGINAKLTQLDSTLKNQKRVLSNLEEQYALTVAEMGENSKEAENLKIKIENQKASIGKTEKEIRNYTARLEEVSQAEKTASKTGKDVTDVLDEMGKSASESGDGFTVLKGAVATFAGNIASSAVGAIKDLAGNIMGLAESTREYRDQMSKLNSAGEDAGYGADYAKQKYTDLYSVLGDETASTTAVSNFMAMGAEQSTLDSLLNSSVGIWAKYGDSIPLDGLAESINETSKVGTVTGNLADALNWAGISEDTFNEKLSKCTSEQERQKLIADTLNSTYGDLAGSYKENNKSIIEANKANADYTQTMAEFGAKVEPITTKVREGFNRILQKILELMSNADMSAVTSAMEGAFDVLVNNVLPAVASGLGWIIDHKDIIVAGLVAIGTAFLAFKVVTLIQGVSKAMQGMTLAQYALNLAMSLNPIGIVIALVAGLVAGFIALWHNCEGFREFFIKLWEKIKAVVGSVVDFIVSLFESVAEFFVNLWNGIKDGAEAVWNGIKSIFVGTAKWFYNTLIKPVADFFTGMWDGLKNGAKNAWEGVKSVFSKVADFFGNIFSTAWKKVKDVFSVGGKIFDGIKDGIVNAFKTIVNAIIKGINKVVAIPFDGINWALKKIKGIDIMGFTPFDWIGTIDVPQIPYLYKGGVLKKGQMGFLEGNGDEAVVPLDHNTGWLDEVASRIVAKGGLVGAGSQTVNNNYNYEFNQTNNSPKSLSRLEIYRQTKNVVNYGMGVS